MEVVPVRSSAWFCIVVGLMMLLQWGFFIGAGQVPELQTEPIRIALHLLAEALTALLLVVSGINLLKGAAWARGFAVFAHGMLAYTVVVSPGYFAQKAEWPPVILFGVLLVLTVLSAWRLLTHSADNPPRSDR